jgi:hypothetical protein
MLRITPTAPGPKTGFFPRAILAVGVVAVLGALATPHAARADLYIRELPDGSIEYSNVPSGKGFKKVRTWDSDGPTVLRSTIQSKGQHRGNVTRAERDADKLTYLPHVHEAGRMYNIPAALILAVIEVESDWDRQAVSHVGAEGLMQLMPGTARDMGVPDSFDPRHNIHGGTKYLRQLANQFNGNVKLMLAAYNAGHMRVMKTGKVPNIEETRRYVRRCMQLYRDYTRTPPDPVELARRVDASKKRAS